ADLHPIQTRQHPVEDDQVGMVVLGRGQGAGAVEGLCHTVALVLQVPAYQRIQLAFVFDDQDCRQSRSVLLGVCVAIGVLTLGGDQTVAILWPNGKLLSRGGKPRRLARSTGCRRRCSPCKSPSSATSAARWSVCAESSREMDRRTSR